MAGKYEPLTRYLASIAAAEQVSMEVSEIDRLVGGLPANARSATWWGNTVRRPQSLAWLSLGRRARVDLASGRVAFSEVGESMHPAVTRSLRRVQPIMNGIEALDTVLRRAAYASVASAVAEHTVFLHPDTVRQAKGQPVFPVIRDMVRRGQFGSAPDGRRVLLDDNTTPTWTFLWAAARAKGPDVQYNHIWTDSQNPDLYTALWNLCATPAFLAKTTDGQNHPEVRRALRYRVYELDGVYPTSGDRPSKPAGFGELIWAPMPDPVADLEVEYRKRLASAPSSRMAVSAREIGWLFSGWKPDRSLTVASPSANGDGEVGADQAGLHDLILNEPPGSGEK